MKAKHWPWRRRGKNRVKPSIHSIFWSKWRKTSVIALKRYSWFMIVAIILLVLIAWALYLKFVMGRGWADWTGFGQYIDAKSELQRGKTLWDWLELLIVPTVLAGGALFFNWQERKSDRILADERRKSDLAIAEEHRKNNLEIAENRRQEEILQNYLDKMSELIIDKQLIEVKRIRNEAIKRNIYIDEEGLDRELTEAQRAVRDMAQVRTLTVLRQLNIDRTNIVLQFLRDADLASYLLVSAHLSEADLGGADFHFMNLNEVQFDRINLRGARLNESNLSEASLLKVDLRDAKMSHNNLSKSFFNLADLRNADLFCANLREATIWMSNLSGADLGRANLCNANLRGCNLSGADLMEANLDFIVLDGADLRGAKVTRRQLARALSLKGALMPNGEKFNPVIHKFF